MFLEWYGLSKDLLFWPGSCCNGLGAKSKVASSEFVLAKKLLLWPRTLNGTSDQYLKRIRGFPEKEHWFFLCFFQVSYQSDVTVLFEDFVWYVTKNKSIAKSSQNVSSEQGHKKLSILRLPNECIRIIIDGLDTHTTPICNCLTDICQK